jgi:hypothetical protein
MQSTRREQERIGREKLARITETCRTIEHKSLDPFVLDIKESIAKIEEHFPRWKNTDDLILDAETLNCLASVVRLQSEWVKHRSTTLYTDPFLLEEKLLQLKKEDIVRTFTAAWHPAVELEQISLHSIREALKYWESLVPMDERWKEIPPLEVETGQATREELIKMKIVLDKAFTQELDTYWHSLKQAVKGKGENGKIKYWDFVGSETYEETTFKAWMASFLITYGYATLEIHTLEEEIFILPNEKPMLKTGSEQLVSVPIPISVDDWRKWKRGEST